MMRITFHIILVMFVAKIIVGCDASDSGIRQRLLFENITVESSVSLPDGTIGRGCEDVMDALNLKICFDPPVHPVGEIHVLMIGERDIELKSGNLVNGIFNTVEFGELEYLIERSDRLDIWGTREQVKRIKKWLSKTPSDAELNRIRAREDEMRKIREEMDHMNRQLKYTFAIRDHLLKFWKKPTNSKSSSPCKVRITQSETGEVQNVEISGCDDNPVLVASLKRAMLKASPLPLPDRSDVFKSDLGFTVNTNLEHNN